MPSPSPIVPSSVELQKGARAGAWPIEARARLSLGIKAALPVVAGYVPIGLALGVLSAGAGLTPLEIGAMSALVYAGASQFIGVAMLSAGTGPVTVALTAFFVNLRHLLMSAALSPYVRRLRPGQVAFFSFFVTDETFAVSATEFRQRGYADPLYMGALYTISYGSWLSATVVGAFVGGALEVPAWLSVDFALPAMFIGLLAGQLGDYGRVAVAVMAGVFVVVFGPFLGGWSVMVASAAAAVAGVGVSRWTRA